MTIAGTRWVQGNIVILLLAASFPFVFNLPRATAADQPIDNKHRSCVICHRSSTPQYDAAAAVASDLDMSMVCMDCHDYAENHHPVNFIPSRQVYADFPLFDGQIKCLTCHDPHGNRKLAYPRMLRGGPYNDRRDICFRCHRQDQYANLNPHVMYDSNGNIREINNNPVCLVCHAAVPDQSNPEEQVFFKADVAFLCWRCHPPMPDSFLNSHLLKKPSTKTLRHMKNVEISNDISLPLLNRDRITCSTCHNPHQAGVIQRSAAAAGEDQHLRLRMPGETICRACHDI